METKNQEIPYQVRQAYGILCSVGARWLFKQTPQGLLCSICNTLVPKNETKNGVPLEQRALQEHTVCLKVYKITTTMGLRNPKVPVSLQGGTWRCRICGEEQKDESLSSLMVFFSKHIKCLEAKEVTETLGIPTEVKYSKRRCEWVVRCQLCGGIVSLAPKIAERHKDCIQRHKRASEILAEISASIQPKPARLDPTPHPNSPVQPKTQPKPEQTSSVVSQPSPEKSPTPRIPSNEVVNIHLREIGPGIYTW
jgi:hypothetical protein